jgi:hypothetical protein
MMTRLPEHEESLWFVAASPVIWALHFVAIYTIAALWCGRFGAESLTPARIAIGILTAAALIAVLWNGWRGYKRHSLRGAHAGVPHEQDTPEDRHRFLGYVALLLSGLSALAIISEGLVIAMIGSCR